MLKSPAAKRALDMMAKGATLEEVEQGFFNEAPAEPQEEGNPPGLKPHIPPG